jgi:hypothetical protein
MRTGAVSLQGCITLKAKIGERPCSGGLPIRRTSMLRLLWSTEGCSAPA